MMIYTKAKENFIKLTRQTNEDDGNKNRNEMKRTKKDIYSTHTLCVNRQNAPQSMFLCSIFFLIISFQFHYYFCLVRVIIFNYNRRCCCLPVD
mgnify:CR=1 FL=1